MKKEDLDIFLNFEADHNLFDSKIQGVNFWHISRKMIYEEITIKKTRNHIGAAHDNVNNISLIKKLKLKAFQIPPAVFRNPLIGHEKADILVFNHSRRIKINGKFDCVYTDEILNELNNSSVVIEQSYLSTHKRPVRTKNLKYTDAINFLANKNKKIIFNKISKIKSDNEVIMNLLILIENEFSITLNKNEILDKIFMMVSMYLAMYPYLEKIIKRTQPKVIIEVVSYEISRYIINAIAHDMNIPTIELQHGTMGKYHIAYNFKDINKLPTFPDYVFTFGQFWKDTTNFPLSESKVKVVGWPYYEKKVKENNQISTVKYTDTKKINILFISQGTIGLELSKFALKLSKILDGNKYQLVYKLHPGEINRWRDEYPWLAETNIQVIDNNNKGMHYYHSNADVQVGVYSTALFEGIGYSLPTYILKLTGHEYMEELYKTEFVYLIDNVYKLKQHLQNDNIKSNNINVDYFWEKNSIMNMVNEISRLLN